MAYEYQNPFTYKSSAVPVQATPSFQDLLDTARTEMTQTIAKQQAATPAPSTTGLSDARNYGGDNGGGDRAGSTGASEGRSSTLGSHNSTPGGDYGTAGKVAGGIAAAALGISPAIGAAIGEKIGSGMRGEGDYNGYGQLGNGGLGVASEATGPGTIGSRDSYGSNESPSGIGADGFGGGGFGGLGGGAGIGADGNTGNAAEGGPSGPGGDGSGGGNSGGDNTGGGGATGGDRGDSGFAKGGKIGLKDVRHFTAGGPNRPGVDDGLVPSSVGDFILTAERTRQIGAAALKALSEGRADIVVLKGKK